MDPKPPIIPYSRWPELKDALLTALLAHGLKVDVHADKGEMHVYAATSGQWIWMEERRVDPSRISHVYDRAGYLEGHGEEEEILERRLLPPFEGLVLELCWTRPLFPGEVAKPHKDDSFPLLESAGAGALSPSRSPAVYEQEVAAKELELLRAQKRLKKALAERAGRPLYYTPEGTPVLYVAETTDAS